MPRVGPTALYICSVTRSSPVKPARLELYSYGLEHKVAPEARLGVFFVLGAKRAALSPSGRSLRAHPSVFVLALRRPLRASFSPPLAGVLLATFSPRTAAARYFKPSS